MNWSGKKGRDEGNDDGLGFYVDSPGEFTADKV